MLNMFCLIQDDECVTPAGINICIVKYYIAGICLLSQISIGLFNICNRDTIMIYARGRKYPQLIRILAILFPLHFVTLEFITYKFIFKSQSKDLKKWVFLIRFTWFHFMNFTPYSMLRKMLFYEPGPLHIT